MLPHFFVETDHSGRISCICQFMAKINNILEALGDRWFYFETLFPLSLVINRRDYRYKLLKNYLPEWLWYLHYWYLLHAVIYWAVYSKSSRIKTSFYYSFVKRDLYVLYTYYKIQPIIERKRFALEIIHSTLAVISIIDSVRRKLNSCRVDK